MSDPKDFVQGFMKKTALFPGTFKVYGPCQTWEVDGAGHVVRYLEDEDRRNALARNNRSCEMWDVSDFDVHDYVTRKQDKPQRIPLTAIGFWDVRGYYWSWTKESLAERIVDTLLEWTHKIITPSIVFADGTTFTGPLHSVAKLKAKAAGRDLEHEEYHEGFETNAGEWLDRDQARDFAVEQGIEHGGTGPLHATHLGSFWENEEDYGQFIHNALVKRPEDVLPHQGGTPPTAQYGVTYRSPIDGSEGTIRLDTSLEPNPEGGLYRRCYCDLQIIINGFAHEEGDWTSYSLPHLRVEAHDMQRLLDGIFEFRPILEQTMAETDMTGLEIKTYLMPHFMRCFGDLVPEWKRREHEEEERRLRLPVGRVPAN